MHLSSNTPQSSNSYRGHSNELDLRVRYVHNCEHSTDKVKEHRDPSGEKYERALELLLHCCAGSIMSADSAAPCRHVGAPPPAVVERVSTAIQGLAQDAGFLAKHGISPAEYNMALPAAVESLRGSMSASNSHRRQFLGHFFKYLMENGSITSVSEPSYGSDTVYRLAVPGIGLVAVIQKGCPDGAHSSVRWSVPDWADETYLWWLCSSTKAHPGEHISKGVNRLRQRFFSEASDALDGIIFHNELCGSSGRPCPKQNKAVVIEGHPTPPPCIYVMPQRENASDEWNWNGTRKVDFPSVLLQSFGITASEVASYVGYVGFQRRGNGSHRATITSRFGAARSTTFRN